jgi:uncharacterized integral membrane protein
MNHLTWLVKLILKATIFLALFAFALNNRSDATVHFFFGQRWNAPMVLIVLVAFCLGLALGILSMVPRWWRQRQVNRRSMAGVSSTAAQTAASAPLSADGT